MPSSSPIATASRPRVQACPSSKWTPGRSGWERSEATPQASNGPGALGRYGPRQGEHHAGALPRGAFDADLAAMVADDLATDAEAQAGALAFGLGGEHGPEDLAQQFRRDALARVMEVQLPPETAWRAFLAGPGLDLHHAAAGH